MPAARQAGTGLRRSLGLPSLTFYGVGLILGAGIYSIIGAAASEAGDGLWLAFLLGAAVALLTGLSYAELAAMYPKAGAEYTYASHAFPRRPWVASSTGYILLGAGLATAATVAAAFGGYLRVFLGWPSMGGALAILAACALLAVAGIRESTWANILMTTLEAGGLALVIFLAFRHADIAGAVGLAPPASLAAAGALVFFAYLGFEDLANLTEEAKRPERQVPQAIFLSVAISAVLYALVGVAALALAGQEALAGSESPLADAAAAVDPRYGAALAALALATTANTVLITLVALSRMLLALARGGHAPKALRSVLPSRGTPLAATLAVVAGAAAFVPFGNVHALGSVASLATLLAFSIVNLVVIRLRFRDPGKRRPFRVPLSAGRMPLLPLLGLLGALAFASQLGWPAIAAGAAMAAAALAVAYLIERRRS
ncbi:MAG TPA: APC family permease, partial [Candidatus Thermoplasmatota archaeon]|nr:APC family permease [Candidatus Thermoplasmatota archaeon]